MQQLLDIFNVIAIVSFFVLLIAVLKKIHAGRSDALVKLEPLHDDDCDSYLVPLVFAKPSSIVEMPLFFYRMLNDEYVKISENEVKDITWECKGSTWTVYLPRGKKVIGLGSIQPFIKMKEEQVQ